MTGRKTIRIECYFYLFIFLSPEPSFSTHFSSFVFSKPTLESREKKKEKEKKKKKEREERGERGERERERREGEKETVAATIL